MPNTPAPPVAVTRRYYPTLSTIVNEDDIPEILGFIKEGLVNLLGKIHYKDLQYNKSPRGDAAFYGLTIVSPKKLAIEIPGTGIALVLKPDSAELHSVTIKQQKTLQLQGFSISKK
ncbi:hypothetical protein [Flavobacterium sp.]|jgi:hypothetical protein|uniref:hypothetical protein n=1 Tax=Flavobacterium sp. TaxID=239 RepID=UPI003783C426